MTKARVFTSEMAASKHPPATSGSAASRSRTLASFSVIRRNGGHAPFDATKITVAMTKAFLSVEGGVGVASSRIHEIVERLTDQVVHALTRRSPTGGVLHIEDIQDQVELELMRAGEQKVARAYVIYREEHAAQRGDPQQQAAVEPGAGASGLSVIEDDGTRVPLDMSRLQHLVAEACQDLADTDPQLLLQDARLSLFDGMPSGDVGATLIMSARALIEKEPNYSRVAARLLLDVLRGEALTALAAEPGRCTQEEMVAHYPDYFAHYMERGVQHGLLDTRLLEFDLTVLGQTLRPERDLQFTYLGLQTLYDRYFLQLSDARVELPQAFFMRVAMGLAINESDREGRAKQFYELLSCFDFMSSTPTLFNSGTLLPQLSSCYLSTVPDDLDGIFSAIKDDAMLSKYAGGLGNDWTPVRSMGTHIQGTQGKSQGIVPFLKVANDTAVAVNQGGKRKGALCAYLETWHLDIEEFLELRKNTGDDRRRTHDMNTANWIPDLFMKRVAEDKDWTLFSPHETSDLHELYGEAFEHRYREYEQQAKNGDIQHHKTVSAVELWRKMLSMLFETGHPWLTFKDPCNLRSPQSHVGVVHSSNLCTEITLNTSAEEIAVCNLGSVNLARHMDENGLQHDKLQHTITVAMRMLDNVVDYNYYAVRTAEDSNLRHRPVGLGIMGFQDALYALNIPYASEKAVEFADRSMETVSYFAIQASTLLAAERGPYQSFTGSLWSQGILPIDSLARLAADRGEYFHIDDSQSLDWDRLREQVKTVGMRNSNCLAIAPTATISNVCGVTQSIEPTYQNLYVKSNLSGEFTVVNPWLAGALKEAGLWDEVMVNDLKYFDGSVQAIDRVPDSLKSLYTNAFELDPRWLVEAAARRQKWIDQAQSLNLYMAEPSGKALDKLYKLAWVRGLKTTYYLRSLGATHMEKGTTTSVQRKESPPLCVVDDPECETCQ